MISQTTAAKVFINLIFYLNLTVTNGLQCYECLGAEEFCNENENLKVINCEEFFEGQPITGCGTAYNDKNGTVAKGCTDDWCKTIKSIFWHDECFMCSSNLCNGSNTINGFATLSSVFFILITFVL